MEKPTPNASEDFLIRHGWALAIVLSLANRSRTLDSWLMKHSPVYRWAALEKFGRSMGLPEGWQELSIKMFHFGTATIQAGTIQNASIGTVTLSSPAERR